MAQEHTAILSGIAIVLCTSGIAHAAAIERAIPSTTRILFEDGTYGEVGVTYTDPHQSGDDALLPEAFTGIPGGLAVPGTTGDVFDSYWTFSGAWKNDINDRLSYAVIFDEPYGADTDYGEGSFPAGVFTYEGTSANLDSYQLSGILAYDVRPDIKLFAGARAQKLDAEADIPFVGPTAGLPPYTADGEADWGFGYLVGAAYSRPDIALRVSLTYYSQIDHELDTEEFGLFDTETDITTPRSVALEFQTGVAPKTLVFGSVRWVQWSEFSIAPPSYTAAVGRPLVDYEEDWFTYTLGVGRQLTDNLAGSLSILYEPDIGGELTTLGPYDGRTIGTAALSYDIEKFNITGGISYGSTGDTSNVFETDYNDGYVWGAGLRIGYTF
jgi:long-chain fatty acid transport protein